jgi:hypothetical protein
MTIIPASIAKEAASAPASVTPASTGVAIGLFAGAGLALGALQPAVGGALVLAIFLSGMLAGLALIAAHDDADSPFHRAMRTTVQLVAPVLAAVLLWSAIALTRSVFDASVLATVFALPVFAAILAGEGFAAALLQIALARLSGIEPAIPVAMLVADKYAGFIGELR